MVQFQRHAPRKAMLNVGRVVETTQQPLLASALGPDLLDFELTLTASMEMAILERIVARCPNIRAVTVSPASSKFRLIDGCFSSLQLQQLSHLTSLTFSHKLSGGDDALVGIIHHVSRPMSVPLRRLAVSGRDDLNYGLVPFTEFRQPASKYDDDVLQRSIFPALRTSGQHLAALHLDALVHSKSVLAMLISTLPGMSSLRDFRITSSDVFQGGSVDVCAPLARAIPPRVRFLGLAECSVDENGLRAFVVESHVSTRRVIVVESVLPWMWDEARTVAQDVEAVDAMVLQRNVTGKSGVVDVFVGARAKKYWL
ncbi:hypothetical protein GGF32_008395 [Allomyces javanicus]|nr:hypothetical protein GGF32_008395 [Allomyces javanicus]